MCHEVVRKFRLMGTALVTHERVRLCVCSRAIARMVETEPQSRLDIIHDERLPVVRPMLA